MQAPRSPPSALTPTTLHVLEARRAAPPARIFLRLQKPDLSHLSLSPAVRELLQRLDPLPQQYENRGILTALPPTLHALRAVAYQAARTDPVLRVLMTHAKSKRRQQRQSTRAAGEQRRRRQSQVQEEMKASDGTMEDDDSEDDASSLPTFHPFRFVFSINGGEWRDAATYAAVVRDDDIIDARIDIVDGERRGSVPLLTYIACELSQLLNSLCSESDSIASQSHVRRADSSGGGIATSSTAAAPASAHTTAHSEPHAAAGTSADARTLSQREPSRCGMIDGRTVYFCCTPNCNRVATVGPCSICVNIGHPSSFACSQECYERNWQIHCQLYHPQVAAATRK